MHNFNFDENGFFTGVSLARLDPLATRHYGEPRYLLPRNATHTPTPNIELGNNERFQWNNGRWSVFVELEPEELEVEEK